MKTNNSDSRITLSVRCHSGAFCTHKVRQATQIKKAVPPQSIDFHKKKTLYKFWVAFGSIPSS